MTNTGKQDITTLHEAIATHNISRLKLLLNQGTDPNAIGADGNISLHIAFIYDEPSGEIVRMLLEHKAEMNAFNDRGMTPLMYAATKNSAYLLTDNSLPLALLIEAGADLDLQTPNGSTALDLATASGKNDVQALLEEALHRREQQAAEKAARGKFAPFHELASSRQKALKNYTSHKKTIVRP